MRASSLSILISHTSAQRRQLPARRSTAWHRAQTVRLDA
nr:MAG TPA: hypothetical protein [Caudoviricetes sp.]